jgi:hypothetical protein
LFDARELKVEELSRKIRKMIERWKS